MLLKYKIEHWREQLEDLLYALFRLLIGFFFFLHGAQKIFGWFSSTGPASLASLMGVAGVVEVIVGILVALGLFTRIAAFFGAGQMLVAYLMVHAPQSVNPLANKGELALVYFAAFLVLMLYGSGKWSLDRMFSP